MSRYLDKSRKALTNLKNLDSLDDLDKYLDEDKSWLKNLNFKNLDEKKKSWSWRDG